MDDLLAAVWITVCRL